MVSRMPCLRGRLHNGQNARPDTNAGPGLVGLDLAPWLLLEQQADSWLSTVGRASCCSQSRQHRRFVDGFLLLTEARVRVSAGPGPLRNQSVALPL